MGDDKLEAILESLFESEDDEELFVLNRGGRPGPGPRTLCCTYSYSGYSA